MGHLQQMTSRFKEVLSGTKDKTLKLKLVEGAVNTPNPQRQSTGRCLIEAPEVRFTTAPPGRIRNDVMCEWLGRELFVEGNGREQHGPI